MDSAKQRILIVDDSKDWVDTCLDLLTEHGYQVFCAGSADEAIAILEKNDVDLVLTDLSMPKTDGLVLIKKVNSMQRGCGLILMTAYPTVDTAVKALKYGAHDYITKPFTPSVLIQTIQNAMDRSALARENFYLRKQLENVQNEENMIGKSEAFQKMISELAMAASLDAPILLTGGSGTGKEVAAKFLHKNSPRNSKNFVPINCAALPGELLESELFGHEAGAFTGATSAKMGLIEAADGGSLFLDEIGEMPLILQAKLLRVLEDKKVRRVGSVKEKSVNIRLISATNRDLSVQIEQNLFRQDLYYRLNVITVRIPSLNERKDDILPLLQYFLNKFQTPSRPSPKSLSPNVLGALYDYHWPGNIRELSNLAQFFIFAAKGGEVTESHLPVHFVTAAKARAQTQKEYFLQTPWSNDLLDTQFTQAKSKLELEFERAYFERVLTLNHWNISQAAEKTGIDRRTLHRMIKRLDLQRPT